MPSYHATFLPGEYVIIKDCKHLQAYLAPRFKFHHPLSEEQLEYGGCLARIVGVSFYHNGDVLYVLESMPGLWHESNLEDYMLTDSDWGNLPKADRHYRIDSERREQQPVVVIRDKHGIECLVVRCIANDRRAKSMQMVAESRSLVGFELRYDFDGTFSGSKSQPE